MNLRQAAEMALEALEEINKLSVGEKAVCLPAEIDGAMEALRQALAQPEQEPPPWWTTVEKILEEYGLQAVDFVADFNKAMGQTEQKPYPEGDVVGPCICGSWPGGKCLKCKRIEPPKAAEWVGLTDEEIMDRWPCETRIEFARWVEAKLKEKNGG